MNNSIIEMTNITKIYPSGVVANEDVNFEVKRGEIHALAGENGAGKSTLMKILFGLETPTSGQIVYDGNIVNITSPVVADKLGIGMVHQHFMLVEELSVVDNLMLGREITNGGFLKRNFAKKELEELSKEFDMPIDPDAIVSSLSIVQKQKLEILKVLFRKANTIILDEPTAVLTPQETEELFKQLILLKERGYTIIIITHKLKEIKQICDRITVMRNGRYMGTHQVSEVSEEDISRLMVGRDVVKNVEKTLAQPKETVLSVNSVEKSMHGKKVLDSVSFEVKAGEIVCLAGVEGNGQREIVRIITGADNSYDGEVKFLDKPTKGVSIRNLRKAGQRHIPEDRIKNGVNINASIKDNLISTRMDEATKVGFTRGRYIENLANRNIEDYLIKCENSSQKVSMLSGGNMQKVVIARETDKLPKLLVADQPTRGVDVGAIEFIHKKIVEIRDDGCAVLLVSCDLAEVFALSDRILVFHEGQIVANITDIKKLTEEELGLYMLGLKRQSEVTNEQI